NTAMTQTAQLQNRITQSPRLITQKKRLCRLFGTSQNTTQRKMRDRPIQCLDDEDLDKKEKKRKKTLSTKYSNSLGFMKPLYNYADETFDYYFEKAATLNQLETFIDSAIEEATKKKNAAESKKTAEKEETPLESLATSSTASIVSTPKKAVPKKKKRNRKNKRRGKDITAEVFKGISSTTVQEPVYSPGTVTNTLLQTWIGSKPGGAICTFGGIYVSDDTVYIYATIEIRDHSVTDFPLWNRYEVETHYHPVPESKNYLHVKGRSGGSAQNVLTANNWLIPGGRATLRQAVQAWDNANPLNKSPHAW
ncbi:hypothetical protein MNBD_NITROSPIRAE01-1572, partial [hydrothermal vent metagenome]